MEQTIVFYVHGFNSGAKSSTAKRIADTLGKDYMVVPLEYHSGHNYHDNMIDMLAQINRVAIDYPLDNVVIIGTSLGGYYAHQLSQKLAIGCVMINPVIDPRNVLTKFVGENLNYVTGEKYCLTDDVINSYPRITHTNRIATAVYVSESDEVLANNVENVKSAIGTYCLVIITKTPHRIDNFKSLVGFKRNVDMCAFNPVVFDN